MISRKLNPIIKEVGYDLFGEEDEDFLEEIISGIAMECPERYESV